MSRFASQATRIVLTSLGLTLSMSLACGEEPGSDASADDVAAEGVAQLGKATAKPQWNGCTSDIQYLQLGTGIAAEVRTKVNAMLADRGTTTEQVFARPTMLTICTDSRFSGFVRGRMLSKTNSGGLLSVAESVEYFDTSKSSVGTLVDVRVRTYTFDLSTGDRLSLVDLFSSAGLSDLRSQCITDSGKFTSVDASTECAMTTERVGGTYTLEREGLRLYPFVLQLADRGVLVPWSSIGKHVTHAKVAKLARGA